MPFEGKTENFDKEPLFKEGYVPGDDEIADAKELIESSELLRNDPRVKELLENDFYDDERDVQYIPINFLNAKMKQLNKEAGIDSEAVYDNVRPSATETDGFEEAA